MAFRYDVVWQAGKLFHLFAVVICAPTEPGNRGAGCSKTTNQKVKKIKQMSNKLRLFLGLTLVGLVASFAWADSPHFIRCSASGVNNDGSLDVSFKIAGLGPNQTLTITASATADAVYGCLNHGQQCPNAANKQEIHQDVSASGTFTSGRNGQITGSLSIDPPPATLDCPNGQRLVLVSISYTPVSVSAPGAGDCIPAPGSFSENFFPQCP